jgi:propanol-preferring alcohol dehydrogenase
MADFIKVKAIHVDLIGDLDPVTAAPLADAGTTSMHAINSARQHLTPDASVAVIGIGGLGHLALQILRATTPSRIFAIDTDTTKLDLARKLGADVALPSDDHAASQILDLTSGVGVDVVLDFVGIDPTLSLARRVIAPGGALRVVGLGGGSFEYSAQASGENVPWGVNIQRSYGGTRQDQRDVIALARNGRLHVETVTYPLADFQRAFDDLHHGRVSGRAVLIP